MLADIATVSGRLVTLRPINREDYPALFRWRSSLETVHMLNFRRRIATFEEFVRDLESLLPNAMLMLVQSKHDGAPIGYALAHTLNPWDGWLGVGLYVVPEYRYRGHGAEAAICALDAIFSWFPVRKVMTEIYSFASPLLQMARAMGFEEAGVVREVYWYKDRYWDAHYMWLTRERWAEGREHLLAIADVQRAYHDRANGGEAEVGEKWQRTAR